MSTAETMDEARALIAVLRTELVESEAKLAIARMSADHSRAVAFEEATRVLVRRNSGSGCSCVMGEDTCWHSDVREIRALAPLDPALMVVSVAELGEAFHLAWATGRRTQRTHHTSDFAPLYALLGLPVDKTK